MKDYPFPVLNHPMDISRDFNRMETPVFLPMSVARFDRAKSSGTLLWRRNAHKIRMSFNQESVNLEESGAWEFPDVYGGKEMELPFSVSFLGPRSLRLKIASHNRPKKIEPSLMLLKEPKALKPWKTLSKKGKTVYQGPYGSLTVEENPWHIEVRDASGKLLTKTQHVLDHRSFRNTDPIPFCFVRSTPEYARRFAATFHIAPDEKFFGCGESFTRLNKRGQKVILFANDAHGVQSDCMYKPVPFFLSSRGYGMFLHTTAPTTFDFGHSYDAANTIFTGDDSLDLFIFLGNPKEVLSEYTTLTGRSPVPPLWSFGLWMSRCTYKSEAETRQVAGQLRKHRIPSDVVHLDTGWFEEEWRCDYRFSKKRFKNPRRMIQDLKKKGFRVSLWQLPYFTPQNRLFSEIVKKGYCALDAKGGLPTEDATLDFSNPKAVKWYQGHLANLLKQGVAAIKVDFGEAAPVNANYASGKTGFMEHNVYPLRYNKAAFDVTKAVTGDSIIWARSAWAGSQRYPLHWGGDAENHGSAMAATLRAGLSFGLCGFSFWSHDIGGFVHPAPKELYRRWTPFGLLTSHSRCHGVPPREPWVYGKDFEDEFRLSVELKYRLMPYIYAQAADCSKQGFPMLRTLFFEYPEDQTSWFIEDEYLFGSDILVAPLMEETKERDVYLPPGLWFDYQTGQSYPGGHWHKMKPSPIPCVILVKNGAALPHLALAQSTAFMDWGKIHWRIFSSTGRASGLLCMPGSGALRKVGFERKGARYEYKAGPPPGKSRHLID